MTEQPLGKSDDAALVRSVAGGSEDALGVLYDRHAGSVYGVALRLTGDRQLAEEVVQETFLALWNRAELFDPALASLATWLRAIARNRTVDRIRAAGRRPPLVSLGAPDASGEPGAPEPELERLGLQGAVIGGSAPDPGPEARAETADALAVVQAALTSMPDVERAVILLAYRDGLTQSEIAERLEWPLGTVKTRTRRALAHLRAAFERDTTERDPTTAVGTGSPEPGDGW